MADDDGINKENNNNNGGGGDGKIAVVGGDEGKDETLNDMVVDGELENTSNIPNNNKNDGHQIKATTSSNTPPTGKPASATIYTSLEHVRETTDFLGCIDGLIFNSLTRS